MKSDDRVENIPLRIDREPNTNEAPASDYAEFASMVDSDKPVAALLLERAAVSDDVKAMMSETEKVLGAIISGIRVSVTTLILGTEAYTLLANAATPAYDTEVYFGRVRQNIYDSISQDGVERFAKHKGIFLRVNTPISKSFIRSTVDVNRETRIDSSFNGPAKSTKITGSIAVCIDGNPDEIPYIDGAELCFLPLEFAPFGFSALQWNAINRLVSMPEQIRKFREWVKTGAERFQREGIEVKAMNTMMHEWRMQHDVLYRFYHRFCENTPGRHTAIHEFMKYFRIFQLESCNYDHIGQYKATQFIRRMGHGEYMEHQPGKISVRMHRDLSIDSKYVKKCNENNKYKQFLDGEYDDKTWKEFI
ncbi:hypothetical protein [Turneriella parva]|uniref:Uncharacterized protein n=1 Tax=Turneriella parva (strain ATCC BAA-1111 / DSM 21527 / NCTC 11395 / H) TaxID=869212 RepID=I4BAA5_TURPD|nr:hypothetical protein [Turneriella parva]AFM14212.1 hypothetical protein Turpa_3578 [Turneriella parva DSM 21527]